MSNLNIQWRMGKPFGVLAILASFSVLSQIPIVFHAIEILGATNRSYLIAYIVISIASLFVIANAQVVLYEGLLVRLRSYDIKDYRAPFLSATIILVVYYVVYYVTYSTLTGVQLFGLQDPLAQYAFCQMIGLILIMLISFWYTRRQSRVFGSSSSS